MKSFARHIKDYVLRPEVGAGLFYAALAIWLAEEGFMGVVLGNEPLVPQMDVVTAWRLVSFAVAAWLSFNLLRRPTGQSALRRILVVASVHAIGAIRFHDLGMMVLSVLPLFALLPAWLLPPTRD